MKKTVLVVCLILLNLSLISCALFQMAYDFVEENQKMPVGKQETILLTEADDGKKIEVKDGTFIHITLPVDPAGGYAWEIKDAPGAARVVVRVGEPAFVPADPASSGGHITYRFQALGLGTETLEIELRIGNNVVDTFRITVESVYAR